MPQPLHIARKTILADHHTVLENGTDNVYCKQLAGTEP
jgi:hypothetical protein